MALAPLIPRITEFIRDILNRMFSRDRVSPRESAAFHEAGHAVAAFAVGIGVDRVSIVGDYDTLGRIVLIQGWPHRQPGFNLRDPNDRRVVKKWILLALAGEFAEAYRAGREPDFGTDGALLDLKHAREWAECLFPQPRECDAFLEKMKRLAHRFVGEPLRWRQISVVAKQLVRRGELDRTQLEQIMNEVAAGEPGAGAE